MDSNVKIYIFSAILLLVFCVLLPLFMKRQRMNDEETSTTAPRGSTSASPAALRKERARRAG